MKPNSTFNCWLNVLVGTGKNRSAMTHEDRERQLIVGYRPVVRAREGRMLGIRQPLDGPVFEKLEHAQYWCWEAMVDHYDRRLGMSDAVIYPFRGMPRLRPAAGPARLHGIQRICEEVVGRRGATRARPNNRKSVD